MVDAQGPDDPPTPSHYPGTLMHTAVPGAAELSRADEVGLPLQPGESQTQIHLSWRDFCYGLTCDMLVALEDPHGTSHAATMLRT
jgi:hypothetical protein